MIRNKPLRRAERFFRWCREKPPRCDGYRNPSVTGFGKNERVTDNFLQGKKTGKIFWKRDENFIFSRRQRWKDHSVLASGSLLTQARSRFRLLLATLQAREMSPNSIYVPASLIRTRPSVCDRIHFRQAILKRFCSFN